MRLLKTGFKLLKNAFKGDFGYFNRINYIKYFNKLKITDKNILIEPQQGRTINGNMFYIIKELAKNGNYKEYNIYVALKKESINGAENILKYNGIDNIKIVKIFSKEYYKIIASAKYLFTDTSFLPFFIKKDGQVILNTWHGTPLKCLGKSSKSDYYNIGNVQKNFFVSDYLLYPNEYTRKHMIEDYMLENICDAKTILAGYPRNTAFFDELSRNKIRKELDLEKKQVLIYMPTWREAKTKDEIQENSVRLKSMLKDWESKLTENQELYINLHPLDRESIDFNEFSKIKQFPSGYETYQFLNIADCLITDYSSVFFDFAITKRKIVLFCYDEEEYLGTRGLYFDFNELPFTKVKNVSDLIVAINKEKDYDEAEFIEKFCKYDNMDITKKICEKVILNKENDLKVEDIPQNRKENILIYVGNLARNGITSSLRNLLCKTIF